MEPARIRPICDYGLIGNCRTAALVSTDGSIDWLCLPRFESDAVFCSLLDPVLGGRFSISPTESFQGTHAYVPETNVLTTRFHTRSGTAELIDCFTVTDEKTKREALWPDHEILRKLRCTRGSVRFQLIFEPTRGYGLCGVPLVHKNGWGVIGKSRENLLALQCSLPPDSIHIVQSGLSRFQARAEFEISEGQEIWFSLIFEDDEPALWVSLGAHAEERLRKTIVYWKNWAGRCRYCGPYEKQVRRSALVLKLLSFAPSGAVIAAPTTSLPEWIGGSRNWDYRYCWLRDASFTVRVLTSLGYVEEARSYVSWLLHSTRLTRKPWKPRLQVLYNVFGENRLEERTAPWLRGYRDSSPVRIGNAAFHQTQLDIYGEVIEALRILAPYLGEIDRETQRLILETGSAILDLWDKPDEGIWESRTRAKHHTHSKVLAWVGLIAVNELIETYGWRRRHDFLGAARKIREAIELSGFNPAIGAYTQTFGGTTLDASLLQMPLLGYCHPGSKRIQSTVSAIQKQLTKNGLVYRYRPGSDGIDVPEGAFGICNFWMAEVLFRSGKIQEGRNWLESLLAREAHQIGLWPEEIHPDTGEYLGNYPQGFSHIGLINAAVTYATCSSGKEEKPAA